MLFHLRRSLQRWSAASRTPSPRREPSCRRLSLPARRALPRPQAGCLLPDANRHATACPCGKSSAAASRATSPIPGQVRRCPSLQRRSAAASFLLPRRDTELVLPLACSLPTLPAPFLFQLKCFLFNLHLQFSLISPSSSALIFPLIVRTFLGAIYELLLLAAVMRLQCVVVCCRIAVCCRIRYYTYTIP